MGVERVEGPDERVIRIEGWVLSMEQQREAIGLIAIETVITAQGQVEAQEEEVGQPRTRQGVERPNPRSGKTHRRGLLPGDLRIRSPSGLSERRRIRRMSLPTVGPGVNLTWASPRRRGRP